MKDIRPKWKRNKRTVPKHPKHCTEARTPRDKCTCECGGKYHGNQKKIGDF